jgi:hypothetical protein
MSSTIADASVYGVAGQGVQINEAQRNVLHDLARHFPPWPNKFKKRKL